MYKEGFGNIPNKDKIKSYLEEGYNNNPGNWVIHSWIVGKTAQNMAKELELDPDLAFACGALHDIGKSDGSNNAKHIIRGYKILRADSYFFPARIALSHSFQIKNVDSYVGEWNVSDDEKDMVADFLKYNEYNNYDLLIQLLDGLIKTEYFGIEKRADGVLKNHGSNSYFDDRKKRLHGLYDYFQSKLEKPIEKYLPRPRWYKFPYNLYRK